MSVDLVTAHTGDPPIFLHAYLSSSVRPTHTYVDVYASLLLWDVIFPKRFVLCTPASRFFQSPPFLALPFLTFLFLLPSSVPPPSIPLNRFLFLTTNYQFVTIAVVINLSVPLPDCSYFSVQLFFSDVIRISNKFDFPF